MLIKETQHGRRHDSAAWKGRWYLCDRCRMLNALLQGCLKQKEHNFQDCQNKKKGGGRGMTGCHSHSKIPSHCKKHLPEPIKNKLKVIISVARFLHGDQTATQTMTDCRVSTTVHGLRNSCEPGENFSADSKKLVCTERPQHIPAQGALPPASSRQNEMLATLICRAGRSCQEKTEPREGPKSQNGRLGCPGQAG